MQNVIAILKRDFKRLLKAPSAMVVVIALLIIPSLYTWYNVLGFWDPYGNTGNIRVAVVNLDEGSSSELTGQLNVGDSIVEALGENTQLCWVFDDYDTAMSDLEAGTDVAVFVIPQNFTADLLTITTSNFQQPALQYYVNMKTGPVSPKITDTGSTTLEETINSTFVETVSDVIVTNLEDYITNSDSFLDQNTSKALSTVNDAITSLENARQQLNGIDTTLENAQTKKAAALQAMENARGALDTLSGAMSSVSSEITNVQNVLTDVMPTAMSSMNDALTALSYLEGVAELSGHIVELQSAESALQECSATLFSQSMPAIITEVANLSGSASELSSTITSQKTLIDQAEIILNSLDSVLDTARTSIQKTDSLISTAEDDLRTVRDDILSVATSDVVSDLIDEGTIDQDAIAQFISSPTTIVTEQLYEPNAYGSAMAPLFMNLTFWIGAFMLLVIMRKEADDDGIEDLSFTQRYLGRFILFAIFAVLQAAICCAGLLAIGVQAANAPALFIGAMVASLAYLSIIYALSVTMQHVGMGLCVILVFLQIPGATGLYPIEMMANFYQNVSPIFPFTYGISIMREAICGFYGATYAIDLAVLLLFFFGFLALGLVLRPLLANVNRTFTKQLHQSDIMNVDEFEIPRQKLPSIQLLRVLKKDQNSHAQIAERYELFEQNRKKRIITIVELGVVVPLVLSIIFNFTVGEKAILLTVWLVAIIAIFIALSVIENIRENLRRELALDSEAQSSTRTDTKQASTAVDATTSTTANAATNAAANTAETEDAAESGEER